MKIDLTKSQCESLIDFIELNLLDVIRKDTDIDSLEWVQNILTANTLFHLAIAGGENPQEALEELTEEEMRKAISNECSRHALCINCPLFLNPDKNGNCYTGNADIKKNYRIMKEAGFFDQENGCKEP